LEFGVWGPGFGVGVLEFGFWVLGFRIRRHRVDVTEIVQQNIYLPGGGKRHLQGYLAHKKTPTPLGHHRALAIDLR